jgi:hypothetical protein
MRAPHFIPLRVTESVPAAPKDSAISGTAGSDWQAASLKTHFFLWVLF